jgi:hypothetical protein
MHSEKPSESGNPSSSWESIGPTCQPTNYMGLAAEIILVHFTVFYSCAEITLG